MFNFKSKSGGGAAAAARGSTRTADDSSSSDDELSDDDYDVLADAAEERSTRRSSSRASSREAPDPRLVGQRMIREGRGWGGGLFSLFSSSSSPGADGGKDGEEPKLPAGWEEEGEQVVMKELDVDIALRMNWRRTEVFYAVHAPSGGCCAGRELGRLGVLAFALRTPVRVWWHVERNEARLALLSSAGELHFRSFAELAVGCCAPRPDHLGVTSMVVRRLLGQCTPEKPLEVKFGSREAKPELRWGSELKMEL